MISKLSSEMSNEKNLFGEPDKNINCEVLKNPARE